MLGQKLVFKLKEKESRRKKLRRLAPMLEEVKLLEIQYFIFIKDKRGRANIEEETSYAVFYFDF